MTDWGMTALHIWNILTRGEARRILTLGSSPKAQAIASFPEPVVDGVLVGLVAGGLVDDVVNEGGVDEGVLLEEGLL